MITVLTCNGYSAVYDVSGRRVSVFESTDVAGTLRAIGVDVVERAVPAVPRYQDFPAEVQV